MKPIAFLESALDDLRAFPEASGWHSGLRVRREPDPEVVRLRQGKEGRRR
jgi:phage-related protein